MQIQVVLGNEIKFTSKLKMTRDELFKDLINIPLQQKQKFKIPINKSQLVTFSRTKRNYYDEEDEEESSYSSDSFESPEEDDEEKIASLSIKSDEYSLTGENSKKLLRKYRSDIDQDTYFSELPNGNKKPKKELTEDDILKKNDQIMKRKLHAKKMLEEEKRQTIEKILNEDGRKLRERQKKLNEEAAKKEQQAEENFKISLTKVKLKHNRDGKIFLRFPQGLTLPKVLLQKSCPNSNSLAPKICGVMNCPNIKKYKDPKTKINYCSVECYKILKNTLHVS